jgi:TolB protein
MRPDGSHVVALTEGMETIARTEWSPDGTRLAVQCCTGDFGRIFVMNADGGGLAEITVGGRLSSSPPAWSPDSRLVAFDTEEGMSIADVTAGVIRDLPIHGAGPSWSPDGHRIAYFAEREGNLDVFVADSDGRHVRRLTDAAGADHSPQWSPDGRHIAFISERDGDEDVFVMDPDGSHQRDLSRSAAPDEAFEWSPNSAEIIYTSYRHGADPLTIGQGDAEVFVVGIGSGPAENLSRSPATWDGDPTWSPDGSLIAFTIRTGRADLAVMRPDGSGRRLLHGLAGPANDCCPDWRP